MQTHSKSGIKTISIDTLKFYLIQSGDDEAVAKQAGCSLAVVQMVRKMFDIKPQVVTKQLVERPVVKRPRPTPKLKHKPLLDNPLEMSVDFAEMRNRKMVQHGSHLLLVAQLETGQHQLNKQDFISACYDAGLGDKIPAHLLS